MKTVFPPPEVFHIFASGSQHEGRNSASTVSFKGDKAYSYRACIGQRVALGVYLMSDIQYSPTTTGHQSDLRQALHHCRRIAAWDCESYAENLHRYNCAINMLREKLSIANRVNAPKHLASMDALYARVVAIAAAFSLLSGGEQYAAPEAPVTSPEELAAIKAEVLAQKARLTQRKKEREAQDAADKAMRGLKAAERLVLWRSGQSVAMQLIRELPCALRLVDDTIETSHGASIPAVAAKPLWGAVRKIKSEGKSIQAEMQLGSYKLNTIHADGAVTVGCHDVAFAELAQMAVTLGLPAYKGA
jgi:hypothetical protein